MGFWDIFKKSKDVQSSSKNKKSIYENAIKISNSEFVIHSDIQDLLWIENGPKKNYFPNTLKNHSMKYNNMVIELSIFNRNEPSLIDIRQKVNQVKDINKIEGPSYYPSYNELNGEQKYVYWNFLSNPYLDLYDIGYVFILYYGLERHLFEGNFQQATRVILKLREIHLNKSFQYYSGNAIVLSCLIHQRADIMVDFVRTLNTEYKKKFSEELFLLGLHSFDIPLVPKDIMRLAKFFGFKKENYIKDHTDLFEKTLESVLLDTYSKPEVILKEIHPDLSQLPNKEMRVFANYSLLDEVIEIPDLLSSESIINELYSILDQSHESVKRKLTEYRKTNVAPTKQNKEKKRKIYNFDYKEEANLLDELKSNKNDPIDKHFTYNKLIDFYYKYRDLDSIYIEKCIEYCKEDIANLDILQNTYVKEELDALSKLKGVYSNKEFDIEVNRIKKEKFNGRIPAFKRLAIIYEKRKEYERALKVSEQAFKYYSNLGTDADGFEKRIEKLKNKIN